MKKLNDLIEKHYQKIAFVLLLVILLNTCSNPTKITNKRINSLSSKIDSLSELVTVLKQTSVTRNDLKIEGLKSEKRMIQSVDRKIIDVNRQSDIEKEIQNLDK